MSASVLNRYSAKIVVILVLVIVSILIAWALQRFQSSPGMDAGTVAILLDTKTESDPDDAVPPDEFEALPLDVPMMLEVTINKPPHPGRRYRRPYVAVWLSDEQSFPVRTILLWVKQSEKGRRWIPDLRQWHRDDSIRRKSSVLDLVDAVSGPTRSYGKHRAAWDGNDDWGKPVPPGTYTLNVEAAREDGTYQLTSEKIRLNDQKFTLDLKGNEEIKSVRVIYNGILSPAN